MRPPVVLPVSLCGKLSRSLVSQRLLNIVSKLTDSSVSCWGGSLSFSFPNEKSNSNDWKTDLLCADKGLSSWNWLVGTKAREGQSIKRWLTYKASFGDFAFFQSVWSTLDINTQTQICICGVFMDKNPQNKTDNVIWRCHVYRLIFMI